MSPPTSLQVALHRASGRSFVVGLIGAAGCVAAWYFAPEQFFPAYLVAMLFWLGLSLGSLAVGMLHHVTGGGWGFPIRRILESGSSTLVLMAILALPVLVGIPTLYIWSQEDVVAGDLILQRKSHYLNVEAFLVRAAVYFAIWIIAAWGLNALTATSDAHKQELRQRRLAILSSWGLVLWGLSVTFASVDWAMSIEPHWFSSMFGVIFMAGQAVSALATAIIVAIFINRFSVTNPLTPPRLHDLGNLLMAMVMFWSYVSLMQFLIIWGANLPEETPWYLVRSHGGWQVAVIALMVLHFLVPVLLLLMRETKRHATRLIPLCLLLLFMRVVDLAWNVLPTFVPDLGMGVPAHAAGHGVAESTSLLSLWPLLVTIPAIGGLWIAMFCWRLSTRVTIPVYEFQSVEEGHHGAEPVAT